MNKAMAGGKIDLVKRHGVGVAVAALVVGAKMARLISRQEILLVQVDVLVGKVTRWGLKADAMIVEVGQIVRTDPIQIRSRIP